MGQQISSVNMYGMDFSRSMLVSLAVNLTRKTGIEWNIDDTIQYFHLRTYENFTGQIYNVMSDGSETTFANLKNGSLCIYPFDTEINAFTGTKYNRFGECIQELRTIFGEYLPENFYYKLHVHHLVGITCNEYM